MSMITLPRRQGLFSCVILCLVALDIVLVLSGLIFYPKVIHEGGLIGAGAAAFMVACYGFLALYSPMRIEKTDARLWKGGAALGILGGLWLGGDLLSNYFIYRDGPANSRISLIVYSVYLLLMMGTALWAARLTSRIRSGLLAAMWYVIVAQLIWGFVELAGYYSFGQTQVGLRFIETEMRADFARSSASDFPTFVIGDFFGAMFFHLLLIGLVAGLVFGSTAAGVGKSLAAFQKRGR